jgi:hypothetical protein
MSDCHVVAVMVDADEIDSIYAVVASTPADGEELLRN